MTKQTLQLYLILIGLICFCNPSGAQETNPVKLIKGIITDAKSGKPVDGGMIFAYEGTKREASVQGRINPKTGAFQMILNPATQYRFHVEAPSYYSTDISYATPPGKEYQELEKNFSMKALPIGSTLFSGQIFAQGSAQVKSTSDLQKALEFLRSQSYVTVTVTVAPDAAKQPKKGKTAATTVSTADGAPLVSQRIEALRAFMDQREINTERIDFITGKKASGKNVSIVLSGVDRNIRR